MDLNLALAHMALPGEAACHGDDNFDWAYKGVVTMGCNPTASGFPSWYTGVKPPILPRLISWFTIYREAGSKPSVNSRVEIKSLQLYIKSKNTGIWNLVNDKNTPNGAFYKEQEGQTNIAWTVNNEVSGGISVKPPLLYYGHGWGDMQDINISDLGGICVTINHRIITDDKNKTDTRLTDKWLVKVGADFYSELSFTPKTSFGSVEGRFLKVLPDWRESSCVTKI